MSSTEIASRTIGSAGQRYRLLQCIGSGGMGTVYRAQDRLTGQPVALKVVPLQSTELGAQVTRPHDVDSATQTATLALDLEALALKTGRLDAASKQAALAPTGRISLRLAGMPMPLATTNTARPSASSASALWERLALAQEFRTLSSLRHPNIISVLDYGFVARRAPFYTMELLDSAQTLLAAGRGLPVGQQVLLLVQLLSALAYLHRHGILHRDVKPSNVMVVEDRDGRRVKLLDFGLALARDQAASQQRQITGTLSHMAPEILAGEELTAASDLFATGVIAYELFTGRHPFDRGDDARLIKSLLHDEPDWSQLSQQTALAAVLRRLLAKAPSDRPTAHQAIDALAAAVGIAVPKETVAQRESTLQAARFVGRAEPWQKLRTAVDSARAGSGGGWLVGGESGVGKSRLLEELRAYALVSGVVAIRGQAVSKGGGAYGVWRDILRSLALQIEIPDSEAGVLKSLLPDLEALLERSIADVAPLDAKATALRLLNTIEPLVLRQTEPLLLLLEDLHWAESESIALLRLLLPACSSRPLLIVATYRDDERPALPGELPESCGIKLDRLPASSIQELCESMVGKEACTKELVDFLVGETEGNGLVSWVPLSVWVSQLVLWECYSVGAGRSVP